MKEYGLIRLVREGIWGGSVFSRGSRFEKLSFLFPGCFVVKNIECFLQCNTTDIALPFSLMTCDRA